MQALILAGGQGTRLRPLTSTIPKPVVPLAGRPFIAHVISWLARHGVEEVILSCGFMAEGVRAVLGGGEHLGVRLRYLHEPEPLGTGGALKFAGDLLEQRFLMLNGDVLTDIDLSAQLAQHERTGARATLALYPVADPSAYGLVRRNGDLSVREFVEKPAPDQIDTNLISAGAYVLERDVLELMPPAGTRCSIERDVFPRLVGRGLYGYEASGYWLDIGTPQRYLQGTLDILDGAMSGGAPGLPAAGLPAYDGRLGPAGAASGGHLRAPVILGSGCQLGTGALVGPRAVLGDGVRVAAGASVSDAVLLDGVSVGEGARIHGAIIAPGAVIGERCVLEEGVVIGAGVRLGAGNVLRAGARIFPGVELSEGAIAF